MVNINGIYSTDNHHYYVIHKNKLNDTELTDENIHQFAEWLPANQLTDDYLLIEHKIDLHHLVQRVIKKLFNFIFILKLKINKKLWKITK